MKKLLILSVFILSGCFGGQIVNIIPYEPSSEETVKVTSDDLSSKGLICKTKSFDPIFENVGFWFSDDKKIAE